MVQLQFEIIPALIGAAAFLLYRLLIISLPPGAKMRDEKASAASETAVAAAAAAIAAAVAIEVAEEEQAESEDEPAGEPGPDKEASKEPVVLAQKANIQHLERSEGAAQISQPVKVAAPAPEKPAAASQWWRSPIVGHMMLLLGLTLAFLIPLLNGPGPEATMDLPISSAQQHEPSLAGASVEESDMPLYIPNPDGTGEEMNYEVAEASASSEALAAPVLPTASEDVFPAEELLSVQLTRQRMAVQQQGDVMYYKSAYWGTLHVGTPAEPYKFVFDTGSGHLILPSTYCRSDTCKAHKRYKRSGSSTAKDIDYDGSIVKPGQPRDQITVSFGTGEVTGVFIEDNVCIEDGKLQIGGIPDTFEASGDELPEGCMKLRIIAATEMSQEPFKAFKFDGVLGLGLEGLSQAPQFNFISVVAENIQGWNRGIPNTFAVFLGEHQDEASEITLGGWRKHRMHGDLSWTPVHEAEMGHWLVRIKSLRVDDEVVRFCDDGCKAVVDTGTSLLAVPTPSFPELYELLRHPSVDEGTCRGSGPRLHFELEGGMVLTLEPQDYSRLEQSKTPWKQNKFQQMMQSNLHCKPMLMSMDLPAPIGPKLFILGEPVLRKYYTVYKAGKDAQVGFAKAIHPIREGEEADDETDAWFWEE